MPPSSPEPEVIWDGPKDSGNMFSGQTSRHFSLFLEKTDVGFYVPKMKKTIQTVTNWKVQKTSLCDGMGVHQCPQHGWSAYMWRYHWCGGLCWNFGDAAVKGMTFPRNFSGLFQQDNARPHYIQRGFVGIECMYAWLACLQSRSVSYWKCMAHHEEENQTMVTTDCWAAQVLYTPRMGKNSTCKTATIDIFSSQTVTVKLKEKLMLPNGKHASVPFLSVLQASISTFVYI